MHLPTVANLSNTVLLKGNVALARNFPRVKRLLDRVTSGLSGKPRKCLTRYSRVGESRIHCVSSTQGLEAFSGRLEGLSQALEIVPSRCVRLVNKPFLVHYADTRSLREYK